MNIIRGCFSILVGAALAIAPATRGRSPFAPERGAIQRKTKDGADANRGDDLRGVCEGAGGFLSQHVGRRENGCRLQSRSGRDHVRRVKAESREPFQVHRELRLPGQGNQGPLGMRLTERMTPIAAALSALATLACCLPLGISAAVGALGLSVALEALRPWLIGLAVILLA